VTFDHFYNLLSLGAFALIVGLLGWVVKSCRDLSSTVAVLAADFASLVGRVVALETARDAANEIMTHVRADVAYIRGRLEGPAPLPRAKPRAK
jgi:hypothetical protein